MYIVYRDVPIKYYHDKRDAYSYAATINALVVDIDHGPPQPHPLVTSIPKNIIQNAADSISVVLVKQSDEPNKNGDVFPDIKPKTSYSPAFNEHRTFG